MGAIQSLNSVLGIATKGVKKDYYESLNQVPGFPKDIPSYPLPGLKWYGPKKLPNSDEIFATTQHTFALAPGDDGTNKVMDFYIKVMEKCGWKFLGYTVRGQHFARFERGNEYCCVDLTTAQSGDEFSSDWQKPSSKDGYRITISYKKG